MFEDNNGLCLKTSELEWLAEKLFSFKHYRRTFDQTWSSWSNARNVMIGSGAPKRLAWLPIGFENIPNN